jgi:hypothetical protein
MKSKGKKVKINKNNMIEPDNIIDNDSKQELKSLNNLPDTEQKDKVNFPNIYSNSKFLTPSSKQINNQSKILNLNMKKINKLYVSSNHKNDKDKNSNEFNKISVLSKITKRDYSNRNNANKILEALNSSSNKNINKLELSKLNSSKEENSLFNNLTKKSINYLNSINKNNISGLNNIRRKYDNLNIDNNSYFNVLSENNSNNNTNITTQRKTLNKHYINTEMNNINNMNINSCYKDMSLKLFLSNKNNINKKFILNYPSESNNESPIKIDLKLKKQIHPKKQENNIKAIKLPSRNEEEPLIKENVGFSYNIGDSIIKNKNNIYSKDSIYINNYTFSCPEELHFYYIHSIQMGKNNENKF